MKRIDPQTISDPSLASNFSMGFLVSTHSLRLQTPTTSTSVKEATLLVTVSACLASSQLGWNYGMLITVDKLWLIVNYG